MNFKTIRQVILIMSRKTVQALVVNCLLLGTMYANNLNAQEIESVRNSSVALELENESLTEVFSLIESKTNYKFAFQVEEISNTIRISGKFKNVSVADVLLEISKQSGLRFKQINNTIHISKKSNKNGEIIEVILQGREITGRVVSQEDNEGLPGVNVIVKGTLQGTVTDVEGNYKLDVPDENSILVFSSVGFFSEEILVGDKTIIDYTLTQDITQLSEIVVTAFGIKKDKKTITYAVQNVETDEITAARPLNIMQGLSGKVAGLSVTGTGSGVGSEAKVLLRGSRSIFGSSQPLYVIDGAVMGGSISNLSPDDIESITVLKGANAAAIYGSRANNGVIVVETKSGSRGKDFAVSLNTSYMASSPILLIDYQNEYGQGNSGVYNEHALQSWGPKFDGSQKAHWSNDPNWPDATTDYTAQPDNVKDFFQTGRNAAVNLGISTSSENSNAYFSYTFTDAAGIIPNNKLKSHNLNVRYNATVLDKLTLDTKVNYIRTNINNQLGNLNGIGGSMLLPRNIKTADIENFDFIDANGQTKQHHWNPSASGAANNPYWSINRVANELLNERVIGLISLKYDITDNFSFLVRTSLDRDNFSNATRFSTDTYSNNDDGWYNRREGNNSEWNSEFLLNYNEQIGSDWHVNASLGGNVRKNSSTWIDVNPSLRNSPLNVPNLFAISNAAFVTASESFNEKQVNSLYAFATIGWKNAVFLDITGRNDWSSTLPKDNWSYFYPSLGLTVVISDLMNSNPAWLSLLKLRGSYAEVGNDTSPYRTARDASIRGGGTSGFLQLSTTIPIADLKPESTTSTEIGLDMKFFKNRLGLDLTWYKSNSTDQLFPVSVPIGSGASNVFLNAGDIQNEGIEMVLSANIIDGSKFRWDMIFNFASNTSTVVKVADGFDNLPLTELGFMGTIKLIEGEQWGDLFSRGFVRDDQGRVIVDSDGTPRVTPGLDIPIANFNPDFLGGWQNILSLGNFDLSFLIDIRQGGSVVSATNARLSRFGVTAATLQGRDGTLVFGENIFSGETAVLDDGTPNNIQVDAETFWNKVGGSNAPIGEAFVIDASNIRMREMVLGYSLPQSVLDGTVLSGVRFALVGRNLFFISNNSNYDPEIFIGTGNVEGMESFAPPTMREYGFNIKIDF